jgi:hypothetical protein
MTIIFLDIDGVIFYNPMNGTVQRQVEERYKGKEHLLSKPYSSAECDKAAVDLFSKSALDYLGKLMQEIGQKTGKEVTIVLSSTWREGRSTEQLKEFFKQHAFSNFLLDKTPKLSARSRAQEIATWILENHERYALSGFVVLDDYDDYLSDIFPERFVEPVHHKLFGAKEYDKALAAALKPLDKSALAQIKTARDKQEKERAERHR